MDIPPSTRAYIELCVDLSEPVDHCRIAAETGLGCEYVLSVICAVISERHGIPSGAPWREHVPTPTVYRKPPRERLGLLPCTCGRQQGHAGRCPAGIRERGRRHRAVVKVG